MAPRSRSRAAQQAAAAAPNASIGDLPEGVLVRVLSFVPLKERLGPVSLVSKRFAAAARSPDLLRQLDVGRLQSVPALRAFTAFLVQHGRHLQRLTLGSRDGTAEGEEAAAGALAACLSVAGSGGQLVELTARGCMLNTEWLAATRTLRRLVLEAGPRSSGLRISPAISALTALTSLLLRGSITFPPGTTLPIAIQVVTVAGAGQATFPEQVAQLPQLGSLCLDWCEYSVASLAALSRLANSLTCLVMESGWIPGSLAALTRLQRLRIWEAGTPEGDEAVVSSALPRLRRLTWLCLMADDPAVPAALASLSSLQYCYLEESGDLYHTPPPLPAGPWLASLRWLHYSTVGLISSTAVLQAATALEFLEVNNSNIVDWGSPAAAAFFDWLAHHPPLRRVRFDLFLRGRFDSLDLLVAHGKRLLRRRPGLEVMSDGEGFGTGRGAMMMRGLICVG